MFLIKFTFYFALSFLIMNIPINEKALFYSLEDMAKPVTESVFSFMKEKSKDGIEKGKSVTKKLFTNTVPPKKDIVKTKRSSTQKPMGKYTQEEMDFLENILKKAE